MRRLPTLAAALLLLALLAPGPLRAQDVPGLAPTAPAPTRPAPPRPTAGKVARVPLPNGLTVLVQEAPAENIVAVELLVRVGLQQEGSNLAGITNLIQEILSERISQDEQGDDVLEVTGTVLNVSTEPDYARISLMTTPDHLDRMLERVGAALRRRSFTTPESERVRTRILQQLEGNQGAFAALYEIFLDNFYRYHPYKRAVTGAAGSVRRMDPQTLEPYFARNYVPNRMVLSVAGRVNRTEVVDKIRREFGRLDPRRETEVPIQWEPQASEREIVLAAGSRLAWVFLGFPAPGVQSRDHAPMRVVQGVLGEGLSSRLWTELREKRGLAYELGSVYPDLEGPSHMLAYIITGPHQVGESRRRILEEIDRLKREGVSSLELEETRQKLIGNYLLARETNKGKAFHLALAEVLGIGYEADLDFLRDLRAVTPADVQRVARQYLENPTLVVARPGGRFYLDF